MYSGQIVLSCDDDDFSADFEYQGPVQPDNVVHNDIVPMFTVIGDLFDDDDLGWLLWSGTEMFQITVSFLPSRLHEVKWKVWLVSWPSA